MFNNNKKQYVNILQQNKQLKLNYKIIQDDKIFREEQSSFLTTDDMLPNDAKFKINTLQKEIESTYITTIFESQNQYIVPTNAIDVISYDSIKIGNKNSVVIPKNEINSVSRYFKDTGIDFILSPYTIMEEYLEDNGNKNSLNFFIYNNIIYTIIFNDKQEISFSKIKALTSFESTQDETFLEDDIVGQKLYEEVNFLEIQQFLNETVEEYYKSGVNIEFLEHIEMIYTLKPMSDEQITSMQDDLMIPISYRAISIDSYIDEIIQDINVKQHNFITPRIKKEKNNIYLWIILAIASILIIIGILNLMQSDSEGSIKDIKQTSPKKEKTVIKTKIKPVEPVMVSLPAHKQNNTAIIENVQMLFDVLPYDAVLKDIEINRDNSTYVSNFIANSDSLSDMQTKLKNIYRSSKILLQHQNKVILNTIIQNDKLLQVSNLNNNTKYKIYNFLSLSQATDYLTGIGIKDSIVKFNTKTKEEYLTYDFSITSKVQSPQEFINFVEKINLQKLSIEIDYPIVFSKTADFIEIKYNIQINQQNKKSVSLKK